jgi:hypothetical protein
MIGLDLFRTSSHLSRSQGVSIRGDWLDYKERGGGSLRPDMNHIRILSFLRNGWKSSSFRSDSSVCFHPSGIHNAWFNKISEKHAAFPLPVNQKPKYACQDGVWTIASDNSLFNSFSVAGDEANNVLFQLYVKCHIIYLQGRHTAYKRGRQWTLYWDRWIQSALSHPVSLRPILILSLSLCPRLPILSFRLFDWNSLKYLTFLISLIRHILYIHIFILVLI